MKENTKKRNTGKAVTHDHPLTVEAMYDRLNSLHTEMDDAKKTHDETAAQATESIARLIGSAAASLTPILPDCDYQGIYSYEPGYEIGFICHIPDRTIQDAGGEEKTKELLAGLPLALEHGDLMAAGETKDTSPIGKAMNTWLERKRACMLTGMFDVVCRQTMLGKLPIDCYLPEPQSGQLETLINRSDWLKAERMWNTSLDDAHGQYLRISLKDSEKAATGTEDMDPDDAFLKHLADSIYNYTKEKNLSS